MGSAKNIQAIEGIYMLDDKGIHRINLSADNLINTLDNKIVQAFNGYSLTHKGRDIVWSAVREKKAILKTDYQGNIVGDPGVHYLVVDCEGGILENFQVQAPISEILGGKGETDDEIQKLCGIFTSMGVHIKRESM